MLLRPTKRNAINNMWANDREGIDDNADTYGLNPTAKVDGDASRLVDFTLNQKNYWWHYL